MTRASVQGAAGVPGGCDETAQGNMGRPGCCFVATAPLGVVTATSVFWHLCEYKSHAEAEAATAPRGTAVSVAPAHLGLHDRRERLETTQRHPRQRCRPASGVPLRAVHGEIHGSDTYSGHERRRHRHSGAEAWHVLAGAQYLETPDGITVLKRGEGGVVPQGPPVMFSTVGTETRRSVLLVLHESDQPGTSAVTDWQPAGRCPT